ncbi:MAG: glucose-1-phosphate adenylyltransferase, partial [Deltaproteobacteria bacterium]|nr:glucose-1-phosphate adenylyltransferase [Deltaproteobacteria bacterium]
LEDSDWYKGTADAIYQNLHFIERYKPEHVLVISGDHIYRMNYTRFLQRHIRTGADLTMVFKKMKVSGRTRYGLAKMDGEGRVVEYREKPERPDSDLVSLTIYAFKTDVLIRWLADVEKHGRTFQIYDEVIPRMVEDGNVYGYLFDGSWEYTRTTDQYFAAHQKLLGKTPEINMNEWDVRTNLEDQMAGDAPPAHFGKGAAVSNSIMGPGCVIEGEVTDSVISPWTRVGKGSVVRSSILLHCADIGDSAYVDRAIMDKNARIEAGCRIGGGRKITLVGKNAVIPAASRIGAGTSIHPDFRAGIAIETGEDEILSNG